MKLAARDKLLITIGVVAVVLVLLVVFLVVPQYGKVADLNAQIDQANADIASAQSLLEQRQQIKSRAAQTDAELLKLLNAMPETPELPGYIVEIQDLCTEAGVWLYSVGPSQPAEDEGYSSIQLNLEIGGSWADTIDVLRRLNSVTRQTRVTEISTRPDPSAEKPQPLPEVPVKTQLRMQIYFIPAGSSTATAVPGAQPAAPAQ